MKILVTGAAGFIGSHIAERLAGDGHQVTGLDCYSDYYDRRLKEQNTGDLRLAGVNVTSTDLSSDDLVEAVRGVEVVFHCAAQPGISATTSFETYVRNNITATYRLLEALRRSDSLKCLVNMSTSSVYGADATDDEEGAPKPTSYYGVTKLAAEQLAMAYNREWGMPVCSLRLFSVYGPRERPEKLYPKLIGSILNDREFPIYGDSRRHQRSFTYVGDVVDCCETVVANIQGCVGQIFNVGSDQTTTTGEAIAIVESVIGRKARLVEKPPRQGDQLRTHACIDKIRRVLGWEPKSGLREGLEAEIEWYEKRVKSEK